ncbi:hypothetical protein EDB85DRAFT_1888398 [Lactarius pseudohatsudake]|nr:hypothetical protein EDB85DRAFT_1888398 [Lactarius pseudohatsudake]
MCVLLNAPAPPTRHPPSIGMTVKTSEPGASPDPTWHGRTSDRLPTRAQGINGWGMRKVESGARVRGFYRFERGIGGALLVSHWGYSIFQFKINNLRGHGCLIVTNHADERQFTGCDLEDSEVHAAHDATSYDPGINGKKQFAFGSSGGLESKQGYDIDILTTTTQTSLVSTPTNVHDHLLERPIVRRAPTHRTATSSYGCSRADLVPVPLILASLILRRAESVDNERISLCPEKRSSVVRGGSAAWNAVECAFRVLPLPSGGGPSVFPILVSAARVRFCASELPAPGRLSGPALGVISVTSQSYRRHRTSAGDLREELCAPHGTNSPHQRHENRGSLELPSHRERTSASFAQATVVAGAVTDVPCQAPGLPWSTIAVPHTTVVRFVAEGRKRCMHETRILFGIVPAGPAILYNASVPVAREIVDDWARGLNKLIAYNLSGVQLDKVNRVSVTILCHAPGNKIDIAIIMNGMEKTVRVRDGVHAGYIARCATWMGDRACDEGYATIVRRRRSSLGNGKTEDGKSGGSDGVGSLVEAGWVWLRFASARRAELAYVMRPEVPRCTAPLLFSGHRDLRTMSTHAIRQAEYHTTQNPWDGNQSSSALAAEAGSLSGALAPRWSAVDDLALEEAVSRELERMGLFVGVAT